MNQNSLPMSAKRSWRGDVVGLNADASAGHAGNCVFWKHFVDHLVTTALQGDVVLASFPSVVEESEAFTGNIAKMETLQIEDVSMLSSCINASRSQSNRLD